MGAAYAFGEQESSTLLKNVVSINKKNKSRMTCNLRRFKNLRPSHNLSATLLL